MQYFKADKGWGPEGNRAALSLTFDNFGEAGELEMGWWDDKPIGNHPTATFVYELIDTLGDVRASYFIEASNAEIYPTQLKDWQSAGHEIGVHAWRHEFWAKCTPEQRTDILQRSFDAFEKIGVKPSGFRPPGGAIPDEAWLEFSNAGLKYASPLSEPIAARVGEMVSLPFCWPDVDVFAVDDRLDEVRKAAGYEPKLVGVKKWNENVLASMQQAIDNGHHRVVVFHPESLLQDPAHVDVLKNLIRFAQEQDVWIASARDVSEFVTNAAH